MSGTPTQQPAAGSASTRTWPATVLYVVAAATVVAWILAMFLVALDEQDEDPPVVLLWALAVLWLPSWIIGTLGGLVSAVTMWMLPAPLVGRFFGSLFSLVMAVGAFVTLGWLF